MKTSIYSCTTAIALITICAIPFNLSAAGLSIKPVNMSDDTQIVAHTPVQPTLVVDDLGMNYDHVYVAIDAMVDRITRLDALIAATKDNQQLSEDLQTIRSELSLQVDALENIIAGVMLMCPVPSNTELLTPDTNCDETSFSGMVNKGVLALMGGEAVKAIEVHYRKDKPSTAHKAKLLYIEAGQPAMPMQFVEKNKTCARIYSDVPLTVAELKTLIDPWERLWETNISDDGKSHTGGYNTRKVYIVLDRSVKMPELTK